MNIMDRYILKQFLQVFLICFCSLTGLFVVLDAVSHLDTFIAYAEGRGSLLAVMGRYYAYQSIGFFDRTAAILALVSAVFTITWLRRYNELTALLAAGVRQRRIVMPLIITSVVIAAMTATSRELVLPVIRDELSRKPTELSGETTRALSPRYDYETDVGLAGASISISEQRIDKPAFLLPKTLQAHGRQLNAEEAYYRPPQGERPGGYLLCKVSQPPNLAEKPSLSLGKRRVLITPHDADWLDEDQCFVASNVAFDQLENTDAWRRFASTRELMTGLRNPSLDYGADVRVAIHSRIVQPLLDVTLMFLGLPLILSRGGRNVFLASGLCFAVVVTFYLVTLGSQMLGSQLWFSPAFAAWLPLMIFIPTAVVMAEPLRE
jgi:lipopolysaccharide export system permease protein